MASQLLPLDPIFSTTGGFLFHFQSLVTRLPHSPKLMNVCVLYTLFFRPHHGRNIFFLLKATRWLKQFFFSFLNPVARFLPNKGLKTLTLLLRAHLLDDTVYGDDAWNLLGHVLGPFFLLGRKPTGRAYPVVRHCSRICLLAVCCQCC